MNRKFYKSWFLDAIISVTWLAVAVITLILAPASEGGIWGTVFSTLVTLVMGVIFAMKAMSCYKVAHRKVGRLQPQLWQNLGSLVLGFYWVMIGCDPTLDWAPAANIFFVLFGIIFIVAGLLDLVLWYKQNAKMKQLIKTLKRSAPHDLKTISRNIDAIADFGYAISPTAFAERIDYLTMVWNSVYPNLILDVNGDNYPGRGYEEFYSACYIAVPGRSNKSVTVTAYKRKK